MRQRILYTIGAFDLALSFVSDLAETSSDVATLGLIGELAARYKDAQTMLAIGKNRDKDQKRVDGASSFGAHETGRSKVSGKKQKLRDEDDQFRP